MHESTRRGLCRLAFALFAALPLFVTLCFCVAEAVPAYQRARVAYWEREATEQFGLETRIDSVDLRSPERMLLYGVKLLDPETKEPVAWLPFIEVVQKSTGIALHATQVDIEAERWQHAWTILHSQFVCRPSDRNQVGLIVLDKVDIRREKATEEHLVRVRTEFQWTPQSSAAISSIRFTPATGESDAKFKLVRTHTAGSQCTDIELAVGSAPLPCRLLSLMRPELATTMGDAKFYGTVNLHLADDDWKASVNGYLSELDAGRLTQPPQLSGEGRVCIDELELTGRGLQRFRGQMYLGPGRISHSLLVSIGEGLQVPIASDLQASNVSLHLFEDMAFDFDLNAAGLRLHGLLTKPKQGHIPFNPGTLMADAERPLAARTGDQRIPLGNVLVAISRGSLGQGYYAAKAAEIVESPMMRYMLHILPSEAEADAARTLRSAGIVSDPRY
ncbi:MAG: hypothetical protein U0892_00535 [Pirellulales bacterium]